MKDDQDKIAAMRRQAQNDVLNDQFVTRCAYDQEHVIRQPKADPDNTKFTTREK